MSVSLNAAYIEGKLASLFSDSQLNSGDYIHQFKLCGGVMPANPTVLTGFTSYASLQPTDATSIWLPPSDGVVSLSAPLTFTPSAAGAITFLRMNVANGYGVFDIPLGLSGTNASGVVSSLTASVGVPVSVTDLRIKLNTAGNLSVGSALANLFLSSIVNSDYMGNPFFIASAASKWNPIANDFSKTVTVNVYDGSIPAKADDAATGTKLWTKSISSNNLFSVTGLGVSLAEGLTANALASGTPTYIRVVKAAYSGTLPQTGVPHSWPATVFQLPIGPPTNGCIMTPGVLVSGQSATITNMTVTLQP